MAGRVSPTAPPGSLLKAPRKMKPGSRRPKRDQHNRHLAMIRKCPCLGCDADPARVAAHLRTGTRGGTGLKPADRYALPLCHYCHIRQHTEGELTFWFRLHIDPAKIAKDLWTDSPNLPAMRAVVFKQREKRQ